MVESGCGQLCKCILILVNTLFALLGVAMLGLGLWLRFGSETKGFFSIDLNTHAFTVVVTGLIVIGAVMLIVAAFGEHGACNESKAALSVFAVLLTILALVEIIGGVLAFLRSDDVALQLVEFYSTLYAKYVITQDKSQAVTLTLFHNALNCCGASGAIEVFVRETCPKGSFLQQLTIPSCPPIIINLFNSKAPLVLGLFLGTAGVMILALVCSTVLCKEVSRSQSSPPLYMLLSSSHSTLSSPLPSPAAYPSPAAAAPLTPIL